MHALKDDPQTTREEAPIFTKTNDQHESSSDYETWGGNRKKGWVARLPDSWIPYVQLTRINPPVPVLLVYFPHLFGLLYAATLQQSPLLETLWMNVVLAGGSLFFSNAAHIWDDLVDASLDAVIERTRHRPIPRKAVKPRAAVIFAITQAICALVFFQWFPLADSLLYAVPSIVGTAYYPFSKRHMSFPQVVLGLCLSWGVFIGALSMGVTPFSMTAPFSMDYPLLFLLLSCIFWTIIYDTVYAHLDLPHDLNLGIGSTAVFFRDNTKSFLWTCLALMTLFMVATGVLQCFGLGYFLIGVSGSLLSLGLMIVKVDVKKASSVCWWFSNGFWYPGFSIAAGLLLEYLSSSKAF